MVKNIKEAIEDPALELANCAFFIPAKGQSTSIPRKNLASCGDRALVQLPIETMLGQGVPSERIIVSTDDETIAELAERSSATVWFRPPELATTTATVRQVLLHDSERLHGMLGDEGIVTVLLPTSPFRRGEDVRRAVRTLQTSPQAHGLVSVSQYPSPVSYRLELEESGCLLGFPDGDEVFNSRSRRQQNASFYYPDGSIYCVRIARFIADPRFFVQGKTLGQVSSLSSSLDIDTIEDLEFAHLIAEKLLKRDS